MDGARLWETGTYYARPYAAIAGGFESVYMSMYKGVGGIAGAVLAGAKDWIAEARIWRRRMGGTLVHQSPMIVSAAQRLDARLALLPQCQRRTVELAEGLRAMPGFRCLPEVPPTNMFHLYLEARAEAVLEARDAIAREDKVWLLGAVQDTEVPGWSKTELYIGDHILDVPNSTLLPLFARLVSR
jgi:threonine aldolase